MKTLSATDTLVAAPENGASVTVVSTDYAVSTSGTTIPSSGWSATVPSVPKGSYLWTRVKFSNGEYSYSCAYHGKDGTNGSNGASGPLPYPCGSYDSTVSYTRDAFKCPVVELDNIYYGMKKTGTVKGVNPKMDVANNGGNWEVFDMFKWLMSEVAFINFGKLASAIFYGQYMFSQYGTNAAGASVETTDGYKDFNYSDPMNASNAFRPNILFDFLSGKAWLNNVVAKGEIHASKGTFSGYIRSSLVDIESSDAVSVTPKYEYTGYAYKLKENLYVDATFHEVVLPCSAEYAGARAIIMDSYFLKTRSVKPATVIRAETGRIYCGLLDSGDVLVPNAIDAIRIDCGSVELIYKSVDEDGSSLNRWIVLNHSCAELESYTEDLI